MYRVLAELGESKERRNQRLPRPHVKPSLTATAPNQVWTWDITKLATLERGVVLHLYVIIDLFSRYVVGWMVGLDSKQLFWWRRHLGRRAKAKGGAERSGAGSCGDDVLAGANRRASARRWRAGRDRPRQRSARARERSGRCGGARARVGPRGVRCGRAEALRRLLLRSRLEDRARVASNDEQVADVLLYDPETGSLSGEFPCFSGF